MRARAGEGKSQSGGRVSLPGRIISFAWTTPAVVAGEKTCTRRFWQPKQAESFRPGDYVQAWTRSPRIGGEFVRYIRLVSVCTETLESMPDADFIAEGFDFLRLTEDGLDALAKNIGQWEAPRGANEIGVTYAWRLFDAWRHGPLKDSRVTVVRFCYPSHTDLLAWLTEQTKKWSVERRGRALLKAGVVGPR